MYLMTSSPELDGELGVLKFLKQKMRLLSLNEIRAFSNKRGVPVPPNSLSPRFASIGKVDQIFA